MHVRREENDERLMLLRLDHAKVPGIYGIDGYREISYKTDDKVVAEILIVFRILSPTH